MPARMPVPSTARTYHCAFYTLFLPQRLPYIQHLITLAPRDPTQHNVLCLTWVYVPACGLHCCYLLQPPAGSCLVLVTHACPARYNAIDCLPLLHGCLTFTTTGTYRKLPYAGARRLPLLTSWTNTRHTLLRGCSTLPLPTGCTTVTRMTPCLYILLYTLYPVGLGADTTFPTGQGPDRTGPDGPAPYRSAFILRPVTGYTKPCCSVAKTLPVLPPITGRYLTNYATC